VSELSSRNNEPFLDHALLDLPGVHENLGAVVSALKPGGLLVVFVPSVTQIGDCIRAISREGLQVKMEKVLELGEGISNGRVWDVRLTSRKSELNGREAQGDRKLKKGPGAENGNGEVEQDDNNDDASAEEDGDAREKRGVNEELMVCRPKVHHLTIGGGFIGMWRKLDGVEG